MEKILKLQGKIKMKRDKDCFGRKATRVLVFPMKTIMSTVLEYEKYNNFALVSTSGSLVI